MLRRGQVGTFLDIDMDDGLFIAREMTLLLGHICGRLWSTNKPKLLVTGGSAATTQTVELSSSCTLVT